MAQVRYKGAAAAGLIIKPLDDLRLVYQRRSGTTHVVLSPVPEILGAMNGDALTAREVLERLSAHYDLGPAQEALAVIAARLEEMAALGLAERL